MQQLRTFFGLLAITFFLGLAFAVTPPTVLGQATKDGETRKQEPEEDDDDDEDLSDADRREVKVSMDKARTIALSRVPGTVIDEELEKERGRLQYAFDIKTDDGKIFDVEISAVTGEVLQAEEDDDADDDDNVSAKTRKQKIVKKQKEVKTARLVTKPH